MRAPVPCEKCGQDLYSAMVRRYEDNERPLLRKNLPDVNPGQATVTFTVETLRRFQLDYRELSEFAAWVCNVKLETFCRADMMRGTGEWARIRARMAEANDS